MSRILKTVLNSLTSIVGYTWLFIFSGLVLFYSAFVLSDDIFNYNPYSGSIIFSAFPIIVTGLYIAFILINHLYIKKMVAMKYIIFTETILALILIVYYIVSVNEPFYWDVLIIYAKYFFLYGE